MQIHSNFFNIISACDCDPVGSFSCNSAGTCSCNPGYEGRKCQSCKCDYYKIGNQCKRKQIQFIIVDSIAGQLIIFILGQYKNSDQLLMWAYM